MADYKLSAKADADLAGIFEYTILNFGLEQARTYLPGLRLHLLNGDLKGFWSLTVTGNWRLIFAYDAATNTATLLDLLDYHGR